MANLNKVMLIGNVTRDPEIKYTPQGRAVTDLGIAVNRTYSTESGERREETTYVDVTLWGRTAETAAEYCKKGRAVYIEGRLQLDSWEDKTSGQKRSKLRVVGDNYQLLDRRRDGAAGPGGEEGGYTERPARREGGESGGYSSGGRPQAPQHSPQPPIEEDDIPF
jgi:single-strand DNA-binding protein